MTLCTCERSEPDYSVSHSPRERSELDPKVLVLDGRWSFKGLKSHTVRRRYAAQLATLAGSLRSVGSLRSLGATHVKSCNLAHVCVSGTTVLRYVLC